MEHLAFASATRLAALVARREVSAVELVDLFLARIERLDGELNSYVHRLDDRALADAEAKDAATLGGSELGPLHGVPVSIKELTFLEGAPATMATRAMADNVASFDAAAVAALRRAGAVPLGKTNAPEFGSVPVTEPALFGACRNPWGLAHSPGGSSGGAAAALAAGLCPVSQGSDGGGSIRIPSSATGLFGLKPSRFRISNGPVMGSQGLDLSTSGALTRTVADAALLLDVMAGYVPGDPAAAPPPPRPFAAQAHEAPGRIRVGVVRDSPIGASTAPVRDALAAMAQALEEVGHDLVEVTLDVPDAVVEHFENIWAAMLASWPLPVDTLEPYNAWLARRGRAVDGGELYASEFAVASFCRRLVPRFHDEFDLLALPVLTDLPPRIGALGALEPEHAWERIKNLVGATPLVNAAGLPAASVPIHWDPATDLPVGVQLVGRYAEEHLVLQVAAQLEESRPWANRHPPGYGPSPATRG